MSADTNTLFWCGSVLNYKGLTQYRGEAPSASQWSKGLLEGLHSIDLETRSFAPIWDSLFPKGKLFPGDASCLDDGIDQTLVPYVNFPYLRTTSVAYSLERKIIGQLKKGVKPLAILNYNTYPHYCQALQRVAARYPDIPWVNLVLDLDDPVADDWSAFKKATKGSAGSVFLSWWGYSHAPVEHKLHLDAGWNGKLPIPKPSDEKVFIYAGKLADYGGIQDLIDAIRVFPHEGVFFDFYGKGRHQDLETLAAADARVRIRGFVSDEALEEACSSALAFLNPRDLQFQGTRMIFPSKLMFYLKFLKPVISPMMPGISPEYDPLLVQPADGTAPSWSRAMERILLTPPSASDALSSLLEKKTWKNQATQLHRFIMSLHP